MPKGKALPGVWRLWSIGDGVKAPADERNASKALWTDSKTIPSMQSVELRSASSAMVECSAQDRASSQGNKQTLGWNAGHCPPVHRNGFMSSTECKGAFVAGTIRDRIRQGQAMAFARR